MRKSEALNLLYFDSGEWRYPDNCFDSIRSTHGQSNEGIQPYLWTSGYLCGFREGFRGVCWKGDKGLGVFRYSDIRRVSGYFLNEFMTREVG